jgi:hypothetical protein
MSVKHTNLEYKLLSNHEGLRDQTRGHCPGLPFGGISILRNSIGQLDEARTRVLDYTVGLYRVDIQEHFSRE